MNPDVREEERVVSLMSKLLKGPEVPTALAVELCRFFLRNDQSKKPPVYVVEEEERKKYTGQYPMAAVTIVEYHVDTVEEAG